MKKLIALISFVVVLSASSSAFAWSPSASKSVQNKNAWTGWDSTMEVTYFLTHLADWGQTLDMASRCSTGSHYEANPILGTCPSGQKVNAYFLGTALLHAGVAYMLPKKYRRLFQSATIATQLGVVANNTSVGVKIKF